MDSTLKVNELVTSKNKYTIFYYKIPVFFGPPYVYSSKSVVSTDKLHGFSTQKSTILLLTFFEKFIVAFYCFI